MLLVAQPARENAGRHRPPEQVALRDVTAEILQLQPDSLGFDALGDDLDPELMGQVDGGPHDRPKAGVARDWPDQRHVELQLVDRPAAQALQRGKARAEVV